MWIPVAISDSRSFVSTAGGGWGVLISLITWGSGVGGSRRGTSRSSGGHIGTLRQCLSNTTIEETEISRCYCTA